MISIFGRSAAPARKHNHFVPDGYIPPKSRQKVVSPPQRAPPRPILKSPAPSRTSTPSRRPPTPNSRVSPHRRVSPQARVSPQLKKITSRGNHCVLTQRPQSAPHIAMPKSILKRAKTPQVENLQNDERFCTVKSVGTSPHCSLGSQSSAASGCYVGGKDEFSIPSRQKNALSQKVLESVGKGPYDGYTGSPISVVDKYDERDNPILWKGLYPPGRRGPPSKSSLRPHARHPNIIFQRVETDAPSCSMRFGNSETNDREFLQLEEIRNCVPCCSPLDWENDSVLKSVVSEERQAYRQCKLEGYLREICAREQEPPEAFANYLFRCYAYANEELNSHKSKHLLGYVEEHLSTLDVWVLRLHRGTLSRLLRSGTAFSGRDNELFLRMLREECVALGNVLLRRVNETERRVEACNEQERNYMKILLLSQRSPLGIMQNLKRRDWR